MRLIVSVPLLLLALTANAAYPERPIRMIVPQAPGSATDNTARIAATELTRELGQQVIVDNRPGGALMIGMDILVRAKPDGYTIACAPIGALAIGPHVVAKAPFDPRKDVQPLGMLTVNQMLLAAAPATPFRTMKDIMDHAKQNPGRLTHASSGNGTPGHIGMEILKSMTGMQLVHVPYKGGAPAIADLIAGQVNLMMESLNSITPHAKAQRVRPIGVTGSKRSDALPEVPTIAESGVPGYEATTWTGVVGPASIPKPIVAQLNAAIGRAIASQSAREKFAAIGAEPTQLTPEQFSEIIRRDYVKWGDAVKRSGAKAD